MNRKKKLEAFEMCWWRRIERISWIQKKINKVALKIAKGKRTLV